MSDNQFLEAYGKPEVLASLSTDVNFQQNMYKLLDGIRDRARYSGQYETEESFILKINGLEYEVEASTRSMDIVPQRDARPVELKINGKIVYEDFSKLNNRNLLSDIGIKECIDKFKSKIEDLERPDHSIDLNLSKY